MRIIETEHSRNNDERSSKNDIILVKSLSAGLVQTT